MCGIAGIIYTDRQRPVQRSALKAMGDAIAHRGPDGDGLFCCGHMGMVHRRLAIIDLDGGHQPIANEDQSVHVVFNGEIYNFAELRSQLQSRGHVFRTRSDTEVLVHLYEDRGPDLVTSLRGMFAFALWDARRQRLLLARDHLGQKPLYVYRDAEKLLFASELKAILAHPNVDRSISAEALEDYLTYGFVPGDRCIFAKARKLPPAHWMTIDVHGNCQPPSRYWQPDFTPDSAVSESEWLERIDAEVLESVRVHTVADVSIGAFLSGGLDSSAVVASLSTVSAAPVQTFSIGFHEKKYSELPAAEEVARKFGTRHHQQIVTPDAVHDLADLIQFYDEPFADASAIPSLAVARMAAEHVKVCLSGDGGDEAFGGYARYIHDLKEAAIRRLLPTWLRKTIFRQVALAWPRTDWLPRPLRLKSFLTNLGADPATAYANTVSACRTELRSRLLRRQLRETLAGYRPEETVERAFRQAPAGDTLSQMLSADVGVLLPDDFLTKVDRASMAYGLEVRPPLLDVRLMETAARMPSGLKVRDGSGKWILKQLFESRLPPQLAHRRKQGFELPVDEWLRGPLKSQMHESVLRPDALIANYVDTNCAKRMYDQHCRRTGRFGQVLWSLLVLSQWLERYVPSSGQVSGAHSDVDGGVTDRTQLSASFGGSPCAAVAEGGVLP